MVMTSIGSDQIMGNEGLKVTAKSNNTSSGFDNVLNGIAYSASIFGDAAAASLDTAGYSTIAAATANATYAASGGPTSYSTSGALGSGTSASYGTGGYSPAYSTSGASASYSTSDASSATSGVDLEEMANYGMQGQAELFAMQLYINTENIMFQGKSNIAKSADDAKRNAVQNFK